jgi:hypothetical protein
VVRSEELREPAAAVYAGTLGVVVERDAVRRGRLSWCLSAWIALGLSGAVAADETADKAMELALADALQARGTEAVSVLRSIDPAHLADGDAETRACMVERLGARKVPAADLSDPALVGLLSAYREYWLRSLRHERPLPDNEAWLLARLNALVKAAGGRPGASMDDLEPALAALIGTHGYHALLGVTSPLRELMLWKTEAEDHYDVALPEGPQRVTVVFMDGFASLGWAGFATCDRHYSGGWTKPDRLYAVRSAYDLESEDFRVSYLAHEGQHFSDNRRFPNLEQPDLEYRAKLVELAMAKTSVYDLLEAFASNVGTDPSVPHSLANGRVIKGLGLRLFPAEGSAPAWRDASVERVNAAAADLLREDSARREAAGVR